MGIDHKTVFAHLKKVRKTKKLDIWLPHELTEKNLMNRVLTATKRFPDPERMVCTLKMFSITKIIFMLHS